MEDQLRTGKHSRLVAWITGLIALIGLGVLPTVSAQDDPLDPIWCIVDSEDASSDCTVQGFGCKQRAYSGAGRIDFENGYDGDHSHLAQGQWVNGCGGQQAEGDHFDDRAFGEFTSTGGHVIGDWDLEEVTPSNSPCSFEFVDGVQGSFDRGIVVPKKDWVSFTCRTPDGPDLDTVYGGSLSIRQSVDDILESMDDEGNEHL